MSIVDHTFDSIGQWTKNQKVSYECNDSLCKVTPKQSSSTPGIKLTNINLPKGRYTFIVTGYSHYSKCILWVFDEDNNKRILPRKVYLPKRLETVEASFVINESISVAIGVLFTEQFDPSKDAFYLQNIKLVEAGLHVSQPIVTSNRDITTVDSFKNFDIYCDKILTMLEHKIQLSQILNQSETDLLDKSGFIEKPLISVIMTNYNNAPNLQTAIASILDQNYSNIELIVVDDGSTDDSHKILQKYTTDERVRVLYNLTNVGTYVSKNRGIQCAKGEYITFQDSDDYSYPIRISQQYLDIMTTESLASMCHYVRMDKNDKLVLNRGERSRIGFITLMVKRSVFDKLGYFDSVRTSADEEFIDRFKTVYGKEKIRISNKILYKALVNPESLTNKEEAVDLNVVDKHFLSANRVVYQTNFREFHQRIREGNSPYVAYPLTTRPFQTPGDLNWTKQPFIKDTVTVSVCSIPSRKELFEQTIQSILPQVDLINVYLNHYERVPQYLIQNKINVVRSDFFGDLNDNGKFFFNIPDGYHFTIDDDIVYPADYVSKMIQKVNQYDRKAIVGVHGMIFEDPFNNFFINRKILSYKMALDRDTFVNLLGTGTVAYHTSLFSEHYDPSLRYAGMVDIWLAIRAKNRQIPMIAVTRPDHWLKSLKNQDKMAPNLYDNYMKANIEQLGDTICPTCVDHNKNNQYHKILHCPTCCKLLEGKSEQKHTVYIRAEGNWNLLDHSGILDLVTEFVVRVPEYIIENNQMDTGFFRTIMGHNGKEIPPEFLAVPITTEEEPVVESRSVDSDLTFTVTVVFHPQNSSQKPLSIYLNHGKNADHPAEVQLNPIITDEFKIPDINDFSDQVEKGIVDVVYKYLQSHCSELEKYRRYFGLPPADLAVTAKDVAVEVIADADVPVETTSTELVTDYRVASAEMVPKTDEIETDTQLVCTYNYVDVTELSDIKDLIESDDLIVKKPRKNARKSHKNGLKNGKIRR